MTLAPGTRLGAYDVFALIGARGMSACGYAALAAMRSHSNETGRTEVYVHPFPGPGRNWQISTGGSAGFPQWRGDGREIFYLAPDNRLMAVPVTLNVNGPIVEAGAPVALFTTRPGSQFAASPDGQRFLINTPLEDAATPPITVVLNWKPRP